ncbi:MAG: Bug family tripartite tricarboxylate transporter substrate binding protein [Burkholderiaceae bacterium]
MKMKRWIAGMAFTMLACCMPALAQDYPVKPIRLLAGFAPGGTTDTLARLIASKLSEKLGQPVVVENRPGAAANIAMDAVAKAPPDGYTLGYAYSSLSINPLVMDSVPFDVLRDLAPVSLIGTVRMYLIVDGALPVNSLNEYIALLKANPGKYSLAANALGGPSHLGAELFKARTGVDVPTIVYKGGAPALVDILGGRVSGMFDTVPGVLPHVRSGKLKALAISGSNRFPGLPNLPTYAEAGLPDLSGIRTWNGIVAPAGTPPAVIRKLNATLHEIVHSPEVRERLTAQAVDPAGGSAADFDAFIRAEMKVWDPVAKAAKIKIN